MSQAISILYNIYARFIQFIFTEMIIYQESGHTVYLGWFFVGLFVFGILLKNLLMLPKSAPNIRNSNICNSDTSRGR